MTSLSVLQVHARYREAGGEDAVVAAEAALLRAAGHHVHTLEARNPEALVPTLRALARAPRNLAAARALRAAVARERPDVVHIHNTWYALSPEVVAASVDVAPVVVTLHNHRLACVNGILFRDGHACTDCVGRSPLPGVLHRCYRGSAALSAVAATTIAVHRRRGTWARVDRLLAPSTVVRDVAVRSGVPSERIVVRPHAVADPGERAAPPSSSRTVAFVGRLSPEKGVDVLLEAWRRAAPGGWELVVAGDGPERRWEAGAPAGVRFTGRLPAGDIARLLLGARALVFPSRSYETFGLAVVEAMAAGAAVLASELPGIPELVADRRAIVRPGDPQAWAAALRRLMADVDVDDAGRRNRARWSSTYSPAAGVASLEAVYRDVVAARAAAERGAT